MSTKSKKSAVDAATKAETLAKAAQVDVESIRTNLAAVKTQVARQLVEVEEELVLNADRLQAVTAAIGIKQQEMKDLHGADNVLMSIDDLRVKLDAEKATFEAAKEALERETEQLQAEAQEARDREQREFEYNRNQERKRDADAWADGRAQRARTEALRIEDFERSLAMREAEIASRQKAQDDAIAQAATFEAKVAEAAEAKAAAQIEAISRNHKHTVAITKAETDATISNLNKDIAHRDQTVAALQSELASTKAQLITALAAQTELAKATVDSAASEKARADALSTFSNLGNSNGQRPRG